MLTSQVAQCVPAACYSVFQGRICSDNRTCCHTETEVAHQTCSLAQPRHTDSGPTSPSADPTSPGAWQGTVTVVSVLSQWYYSTWTKFLGQSRSRSQVCRSRRGRLTSKPSGRSLNPLQPLPPRWPCSEGVRLQSGRSPGSNPACAGNIRGPSHTSDLKMSTPVAIPFQAPGVIGSALGQVGPVSVYCDWVRWKV